MKILCPYHDDHVPSLHIYDDHFYCFVCGERGSLDTLHNIGVRVQREKEVAAPPEDVKKTIEYINTLPVEKYRGVPLPHDAKYYYIVWPNNDFYIKRVKDTSIKKSKYLAPKGVKRPIFIALEGGQLSRSLIITEGELNAISLASALSRTYVDAHTPTIVSGGGADNLIKYLDFYKDYDMIHVVVDNDKAGALALLKLVPELVKITPWTYHNLVHRDFNQVLQEGGYSGVAEEAERMGLL